MPLMPEALLDRAAEGWHSGAMSMPPGYPHDLSDEQVEEVIATYSAGLSPNINDVMRSAPLVQIGQTELQIRASRQLRDAISDFNESSESASSELKSAVEAFDASSRAAAEKLSKLTWLLVALTVALLGVTIALIVTSG